jgi:flagellar basal-body rod modification protein FlgD
VSNISPVTQLGNQTSGDTNPLQQATGGQDLASQDVFLQLLMAQLQNQDPLDPMDNQQFLSQIAQLTTVEQLKTANSNLQTLQLYQMSINNAQSVSMIGRQIKAAGNSFQLASEGGDASLQYRLKSDAATVKITIYNQNQQAVRTIELTGVKQGEQSVTWDGHNSDNSPLAAGEYTFTVTAQDAQGNSVQADTFITGTVTGVVFEDGVPKLKIGDHTVSMGDIYSVGQ